MLQAWSRSIQGTAMSTVKTATTVWRRDAIRRQTKLHLLNVRLAGLLGLAFGLPVGLAVFPLADLLLTQQTASQIGKESRHLLFCVASIQPCVLWTIRLLHVWHESDKHGLPAVKAVRRLVGRLVGWLAVYGCAGYSYLRMRADPRPSDLTMVTPPINDSGYNSKEKRHAHLSQHRREGS